MLNSEALRQVLPDNCAYPVVVETDLAGRATGRIWRGDQWLRARIGALIPDFGTLGARLARYGVTGVTDASVTTGESEARILASAVSSGALPQQLTLMSGGFLPESLDRSYRVGPVKILLDEVNLGDLESAVATIRRARSWQRNVAVHCVTASELAFALAAFGSAGVCAGDRIEHGGVVNDAAAGEIARLGLHVVTQPGFVSERGDEYLDDVEPENISLLYRCGGLMARGIKVGGSTDAPYTNPDPWAAIAAAVTRKTRSGTIIAAEERIDPVRALHLFLSDANDPGGARRMIEPGADANLCLLNMSLESALAAPDASCVAATVCAGRVVFDARA